MKLYELRFIRDSKMYGTFDTEVLGLFSDRIEAELEAKETIDEVYEELYSYYLESFNTEVELKYKENVNVITVDFGFTKEYIAIAIIEYEDGVLKYDAIDLI